MALVRLSLLGGFGASDASGLPLRLPTRKVEALLAYLALTRGRPSHREMLARLLWGSSGTEHAQASLRHALAALRRALGPGADATLAIDTRHGTVALEPSDVTADALEFESLATAPGASPDALRRAVALYQGDLLEGFQLKVSAFAAWRVREAGRLRGLAVAALLALSRRAETESPDSGDVAALARRLLELDPAQEPGHRALMRHYAVLGQAALALEQYELCRDTLAQKLGVGPSDETKRLHDSLRAGAEDSPEVGAVAGVGPPGEPLDGTEPREAGAERTTPLERRQLTILVCHPEPPASLAPAGDDPEDLLDATAAQHRAVATVIERHGGRVAKHMGDWTIAYFGWPAAPEDDAERAVRAGLALRRIATSSEPRAPPAYPLRMLSLDHKSRRQLGRG